MTPQIIITLSPQGSLIAELPGTNGMRRPVPIDSIESISRILHAQLGRQNVELGTDGAPTQRQVRHWEKHSQFPDLQCPFCKAENKIKSNKAKAQISEKFKTVIEFSDSGLEKIHRIPAKSRKLQSPRRTNQIANSHAKIEDQL